MMFDDSSVKLRAMPNFEALFIGPRKFTAQARRPLVCSASYQIIIFLNVVARKVEIQPRYV